MKRLMTRRAAMGATFATLALPTLARAQGSTGQAPADMRVTLSFADIVMTATLHDNPSARDFYSMVPTSLTIEDFSNNEKIVHLPRRLTLEGQTPFGDERPGDLCYYVPWGNLALFYTPYTYGSSLIRLGRFDNGAEPLRTRGTFPVSIDRVQS